MSNSLLLWQIDAGWPTLFGFGFGSLAMLGWLGAAAAPILIHLWNKRKYHEVPWAAMEYLLAAMRRNARRIQLEQWLLLALRTLLVLLLVLAAAQPYLEQVGLPFVPGQRTLKLLVLDGSYSMAYKPTDKTRFEKAKQIAQQIVEESRQGDAFALVLMAAPPSVIVGTPAVEARPFLEEIENLKMLHAGADLPVTLAKVEEILDRAAGSGLARSEVYFISDMGRNTWMPELGRRESPAEARGGASPAGKSTSSGAAHAQGSAVADSEATGLDAMAAFRQQVERLAKQATLVVIDVGQGGGAENLAVTELTTNDPFVTVGAEMAFNVEVRNFGQQAQNHHLLECFVDGRRVKETYVDVAPGAEARAGFNYRFESAGDHVVEARLGADLLDIDNHRWLSQPVKSHLRVLCVNGKPAAGGLAGATDYIVRALNPEEDPAQLGVVRTDVIAESGLLEQNLAQYDCVFLCNIGQFTGSEARWLDSYLRQGGGLVFFLGDRVQSDRYNQVLDSERGVHVLPARIGPLAAESQYRFDPLDYRDPLVSVFKGREQAGLLTTPIYRYFKLTLPEHSRASVPLAFDDGDPAIVTETIERGRVILAATDGSLSSVDAVHRTPWNAWPAWPSFLPMVQEILAAAVAGQQGQRNVQVGQPLGELVDANSATAALVLTTPDKRREELRTTTDQDGVRWSFGDTMLSGIYAVEYGSPRPHDEDYAVNVDTAESNLARIDPEELPKGFVMHSQSGIDEPTNAEVGRRSDLHRMLLYGVLGLLFTETLLAWRFGNRRS